MVNSYESGLLGRLTNLCAYDIYNTPDNIGINK
jgi:hypothetical protein